MGFIKNGVIRTKHWYRKRSVLNKVRVLLFDDHATNCERLRSMLRQESGAFIDVTPSVATALEMHRRTPYHVVIAGIAPGSWAPYELFKAIRKTDVEYRGFTPVVAVIWFPSREEGQRAIAAGFNAHISAPFGASDVINAIIQVLHDAANREA
jgi:PleD family two-component response regulator